jgi:NADH:ubiquinone oxidoreductase subunit H
MFQEDTFLAIFETVKMGELVTGWYRGSTITLFIGSIRTVIETVTVEISMDTFVIGTFELVRTTSVLT